jgi:hypothetical protein
MAAVGGVAQKGNRPETNAANTAAHIVAREEFGSD